MRPATTRTGLAGPRSSQPDVRPATQSAGRLHPYDHRPSVGAVLDKRPARRPMNPLRRLSGERWEAMEPTWRDAKPGIIHAALERAKARPSGNWYVVGASRDIRAGSPFGTTVAGVELVLWRSPGPENGGRGALHAGPGACPHLGAAMATATQSGCELICRWHGLALGPSGRAGWRPMPAHDDGVLAWVRLDAVGTEEPTAAPVLPVRPRHAESLVAVATMVGTCEPDDVLANRLDPWHGAWFHPHSFADLRVDAAPTRTATEAEDHFDLHVAFRLTKTYGVPVEEKVAELQQSKRELADAILSADVGMIRDLKAEDVEWLLS